MKYLAKIEKRHAEEGYPDGYYLVTFPDCPGCSTYGKTLEEAKEYAAEALDVWLLSRCKVKIKHELIPLPKSEVEESKDHYAIDAYAEVMGYVLARNRRLLWYLLVSELLNMLWLVPLTIIALSVLYPLILLMLATALLVPFEYSVKRLFSAYFALQGIGFKMLARIRDNLQRLERDAQGLQETRELQRLLAVS